MTAEGVFHSHLDVPVAGGRLRVAMAGARSGRPVVLAVHGITASHLAWTKVARHIGDEATFVAVDLRGRGESAELPAPYDMSAHVEDMVAVLDHLEVVSALVAGHSMGAYVATLLARKRPERCSGLVLVDGGLPLPLPPGTGDDPDAALDAFLGPALARLRMTFESRQAYHAFWTARPAFSRPGVWDDDIAAYVDYDLTGEEPSLRSRVSEEAVRTNGTEILLDEDIRTSVGSTALPILLLRAPRALLDQSHPLIPDDVAAHWAATTPGLVDELVPDTNHYLIIMADREATVVADGIRRLLP